MRDKIQKVYKEIVLIFKKSPWTGRTIAVYALLLVLLKQLVIGYIYGGQLQ